MLIGICGYPKSGKTTAAKYLAHSKGFALCDDSFYLRKAATSFLQIPVTDALSQEKKEGLVTLPEGQITLREYLGRFGKALEREFGQNVIPYLYNEIMLSSDIGNAVLTSLRMDQPLFWESKGAIILQIVRPGYTVYHDFDKYELPKNAYTIVNNGSKEEFHRSLDAFLEQVNGNSNLYRNY